MNKNILLLSTLLILLVSGQANAQTQFIKYKKYLIPISVAVQAKPPQSMSYQYDALGRLSKVDNSKNGAKDYSYDPAGNRTTETKSAD